MIDQTPGLELESESDGIVDQKPRPHLTPSGEMFLP